jgi:hypothetical protein
VRHLETSCPFCHARLGQELRERIAPDTSARLTRAAAFLFASSVAVSGCGSEVTVGDGHGGSSAQASGTTTSSGHESSASSASGQGGAGGDAAGVGGAVAAYGAPAVGGGGGAAGGGSEGGGNSQPLYGAAPAPAG